MDARNRRDGAAIEEVGWYNPIAKDEMYSLKEDRILHWLQEGAQPTDTAHDILRTAGLAHKWHLMKQGLDEAAVEKEMKKMGPRTRRCIEAPTPAGRSKSS